MENKEILSILKSQLKAYENKEISQQTIRSMTPDDVAGVLGDLEYFLSIFIANAQEQNTEDTASNLTNNQIMFLHYFLTELSQNFFPMAHNQAPLENQQIVCAEIPNVFRNKLHTSLNDLNNMMERLNENLIPSDEMSQLMDKLNQIEQMSRRLKQTTQAVQDSVHMISHVVGNNYI